MKRKKLLEFIAWFSKNRRRYDQKDCMSCIAAHAIAWRGMLKRDELVYGGSETLMEIFELKRPIAMELYDPGVTSGVTKPPRRAQAVATLKRLIKTGKVDWRA